MSMRSTKPHFANEFLRFAQHHLEMMNPQTNFRFAQHHLEMMNPNVDMFSSTHRFTQHHLEMMDPDEHAVIHKINSPGLHNTISR
jgi:hypothetical protein